MIIIDSYRDYGSQADQNGATIMISPRRSLIEPPIVGGLTAAVRASLR